MDPSPTFPFAARKGRRRSGLLLPGGFLGSFPGGLFRRGLLGGFLHRFLGWRFLGDGFLGSGFPSGFLRRSFAPGFLGVWLFVPAVWFFVDAVHRIPRSEGELGIAPGEWQAWVDSAFASALLVTLALKAPAFIAAVPINENPAAGAAGRGIGSMLIAWLVLAYALKQRWHGLIESDERDRAARGRAAAACPPHPVSGGSYLEWDWPTRSAGRVVSMAYSRRDTIASKLTWLRPTKRSPSPGRAWTRVRRSAGVRSK